MTDGAISAKKAAKNPDPGTGRRGKLAPKAQASPDKGRCGPKFEQLDEELQKLVRQMLIEGATFEDAAEAVKAAGVAKFPQRAIETYFRSNLALQEARIAHQVKAAKALKAALQKPGSSQAKLAEAVLITGLMGMSRKDSSVRLHHALRIREQEANLKLKKKALVLRTEKLEMDKRVLAARLTAEESKQELVRARLAHLQQALEKSGEDHALGPEVMRQIQEIYGIVSVPASGEIGGMNGEA